MWSSRTRVAGALVAVALATGCVAAFGGATAGAEDELPPEVYVALGDSYSSGDGAPPYDPAPNCNRATVAWPRLLDADSASIASVDLRACGGARTTHLTAPWPENALPPQIPTTADPTVTLVTLTIGGNDVAFRDYLLTCILLFCTAPDDPTYTSRLATLQSTLESTVYPALHQAYPNARIAHVGYPRIVPPPGQPAPAGLCLLWLTPADQAAFTGWIDRLNATLQAATAHDGDITFVDAGSAFNGHDMCAATPWVNPLLSPDSMGHPNALGQRALELTVADALGVPLD